MTHPSFHNPEPALFSDSDLIHELKRRGYSVVRSDQVCEITCEALVGAEALRWARHDVNQAIAGTLTQQLAYELFNVAPVKVTKFPIGYGGRDEPGDRHTIRVVFIKEKSDEEKSKDHAQAASEDGAPKEDQQPTEGCGGGA